MKPEQGRPKFASQTSAAVAHKLARDLRRMSKMFAHHSWTEYLFKMRWSINGEPADWRFK